MVPKAVKCWLDAALGLFYPEVCQLCSTERAGPDSGYVCSACRNRIRSIVPPFCERCGLPAQGEITQAFECSNCRESQWRFVWARSAVEASGVALEIIHRYKYQRAMWFEPLLAELLVTSARPVLAQDHWDLVVPVPLHPVKQREREFNQAERLAARLARVLQIPVNTRLIKRVKLTRTQTMLSRAERAENVRKAFAGYSGQALEGRRVILVDDVLTTGATTNACAKVLLGLGAGAVCVWTVARAIQ